MTLCTVKILDAKDFVGSITIMYLDSTTYGFTILFVRKLLIQ